MAQQTQEVAAKNLSALQAESITSSTLSGSIEALLAKVITKEEFLRRATQDTLVLCGTSLEHLSSHLRAGSIMSHNTDFPAEQDEIHFYTVHNSAGASLAESLKKTRFNVALGLITGEAQRNAMVAELRLPLNSYAAHTAALEVLELGFSLAEGGEALDRILRRAHSAINHIASAMGLSENELPADRAEFQRAEQNPSEYLISERGVTRAWLEHAISVAQKRAGILLVVDPAVLESNPDAQEQIEMGQIRIIPAGIQFHQIRAVVALGKIEEAALAQLRA